MGQDKKKKDKSDLNKKTDNVLENIASGTEKILKKGVRLVEKTVEGAVIGAHGKPDPVEKVVGGIVGGAKSLGKELAKDTQKVVDYTADKVKDLKDTVKSKKSQD
ncbi:MAG: hypothetical protein IH840_00720 [Candidatus Heimdallarchaeota archaeon]|nr:hypothetical protein [Candidatus Heimdallarchaeota archaeon]